MVSLSTKAGWPKYSLLVSNRNARPTTWTLASGATGLVAEFGDACALELHARPLAGDVEPAKALADRHWRVRMTASQTFRGLLQTHLWLPLGGDLNVIHTASGRRHRAAILT